MGRNTIEEGSPSEGYTKSFEWWEPEKQHCKN